MGILTYLERLPDLADERAACVQGALAALEALDQLGKAADAWLSSIERAQAMETTDRHMVEELRQTAAALARDLWEAEGRLRRALGTLAQLGEAEQRLATSFQATTAHRASGDGAIDEKRRELQRVQEELGALLEAQKRAIAL